MKPHLLLAPLVLALSSAAAHAQSLGAPAPADAKDMKDMKYMHEVQTRSESDAGPYVAAYGGANFAQDYIDPKIGVNTPGVGNFHYDGYSNGEPGAVGGLKFGYNFASFPITGNFRLQPAVEVEGLYLGATSKSTYNTPGAALAGVPSSIAIKDRFNSAAAFVNGILRLKTGTLFTPYVGVGVGSQYLNASDSTVTTQNYFGVNNTATHVESDEFDFAAQALAGFDIELAKHWSLFTEYKFIAVIAPDLKENDIDAFGDAVKEHDSFIGQHLITAGVKYGF
jgi:opacity protein-like surface antigen